MSVGLGEALMEADARNRQLTDSNRELVKALRDLVGVAEANDLKDHPRVNKARAVLARARSLTHPVDILKDLGVKLSPGQEANARKQCDGEVE